MAPIVAKAPDFNVVALWLLPILLFINWAECQNPDPTVSIVDDPEFAKQRDCVRGCLWNYSGNLAPILGCPGTGGYRNSCYCRANLASSASHFISTCVDSVCTAHPPDISSALSVYNRYCLAAAGKATIPNSVADPTITLADNPTYKKQRNCVRGCLLEYSGNLAAALQCPGAGGYRDSCFCRDDLTSYATSFLSSCVNVGCTTHPPDISSALHVYGGYCAGTLTEDAGRVDPTVSLASDAAFLDQKICVQGCLWSYSVNLDWFLGCPGAGGGFRDSCFCRETGPVFTASDGGTTGAPLTTMATTTSPATTTDGATSSHNTRGSSATSTGTAGTTDGSNGQGSGSENSGDRKLSSGAVAGIVIGIAAVLVAVGAWLWPKPKDRTIDQE